MYGYDAGWRDPRVVLEVGKTPYEQLVVLDEFCESGSHVEDAIAWLEANDKPEGMVFCEHEPADIETFEKAGWPATKAEKSLDAGIAEVRRRLDDDGNAPVDENAAQGEAFIVSRGTPSDIQRERERYREPDVEADGGEAESPESAPDREPRVGLLVSDRCQQTIREFLGYKESHVGGSQAIDHCLDSLRYLCMGVASGDIETGPPIDDIGW